MSQLFGWVPDEGDADAGTVMRWMVAALRVHAGQRVAVWTLPGLGIGAIEPPALPDETTDVEPAVSSDGRFRLWMAGEAFRSGDSGLPLHAVAESRTLLFRRTLLDRWQQRGASVVELLDGEYHIAIWDSRDRVLTLINDRFGGLPQYWAQSRRGVAFAGGVRGVLMAPGVSAAPDLDGLREVATFGGYRLADRTNVSSVKMVPGATVQTIRPGARSAIRYWSWSDVPAQTARDVDGAVAMLQERWRAAIACRMTDRARYGQTLSGGLDSRAILAEGAHGPEWTAITYGVPGCDDAAYAKRAAEAVGATWMFQPLYAGDWLQVRSAHIQSTDGLIELGDLMHLETLPLQRERFDVHMCGYIGDAVSGPTFASVQTVDDVLQSLPYYGTSISLVYADAIARGRGLLAELQPAPARFALFEHKLPQSTNRWTAAWRPWLRVRKPFVDYALFDLCQGLPVHLRVEGQLHERWLRASYPNCFASIPNQKTGLPVLTRRWRVQLARARRGARARLLPLVPKRWRPAPRIRSYHDDGRVWRQPDVVERLVDAVLRPGALCADAFGCEKVAALVEGWKATAAAPAQVIGALYVYETYHAGLGPFLRDARARVDQLGLEHRGAAPGV